MPLKPHGIYFHGKLQGGKVFLKNPSRALVPIIASGHTPGQFNQSLLGVAPEISTFSSTPGDPNE